MEFSARAAVVALCLGISGSTYASDSGFYVGVNIGQSDFSVDRNDVGVAFVPLIAIAPSPLPFPPLAPAPGFFDVVVTPFEPAPRGVSPIGASNLELHHVDKTLSVTLGYQINAFLAAELSYVDLGTVEMRATFPQSSLFFPVSPAFIRQSTDIDVSGIQLSMLGRWPITPAWSAFGKIGYLFADTDVDYAVRLDGSTEHFDVPKVSSENIVVGAGLDFNLGSKWTARLEYQRHLGVSEDAFINKPDVDSVSLGIFLRL